MRDSVGVSSGIWTGPLYVGSPDKFDVASDGHQCAPPLGIMGDTKGNCDSPSSGKSNVSSMSPRPRPRR
jgi:hypothetical protein